MAVDKLVDSTQLDADLLSVANAIRAKSGGSGTLAFPADFVSEIGAISTGGGLEYDTGTFTIASDVTGADFTVQHGLGKKPDVVIVWTEDFTDDNLPSYDETTALGFIYLDRMIDMAQWTSTTGKTNYGLYAYANIGSGRDKYQVATPGSTTYTYNVPPTASVFTCKRIANSYWRAGVTYHYFVSEAWW